MKSEKSFARFEITNPNKTWVSQEIDKLLSEWTEWNKICQNLEDSPDFVEGSCAESIKDGYDNIYKHEVLREKTLVFIRNHFSGADFILSQWASHPHEDVTSRLSRKVPTWIHRLQILKSSMDYVLVPDGFWAERGKDFLTTLSKSTAEGAIEVAISYLKNPLR